MNGARRWLFVVVPVVAVAVGVIAGVLLADGDDSTTGRTTSVHVPRYAGPALSLPATTTLPLAATQSSPENATAPDYEVTTAPLDCLFSTDPACGDWHWDPPVAPDARTDATITVTMDPADPVVGETVTFTVEWSDPDADQGVMSTFDDGQCGDGCPGAVAAARVSDTSDRAMDAPIAISGKGTFQRTTVYRQPGTYTWRVGTSTSSSSFAALQRAHGCGLSDPYASEASTSGTITIAPDLGGG